jgi:hypothetical protein
LSSDAAEAFLAAVRDAQAALYARDYERAFAGLSPGVEFHFADWVPDADVTHGRDALVRYFERLLEGIDWKVEAQEAEEVGPGRFVVRQLGVGTGRTSGISAPREIYSLFELGPEGLVVRVREFDTRDEALAAS